MQLRRVLVEAAIAQLLMAEAVLDDVEGVLDDGAHLRERPLDRLCQLPQCFRQGFDDAALDRDVPADVAILKFRPLVRPGVAGIAEDIFLLSMQQRRRLGNVGFIGGSAHHRMDQARGDIDPDMGLHPEVPLIALLRLVHLRITALLLVLRRRRGGNDGRIDDRPVPHQQAALLQHRPDLVEQPLCQIVPFQPMPEMQYRSRVRHRGAGQRDPGKAAQRLAVVERVLDRFIGQPVPLLHKIDPQHALQRDRRPTALAFRIERGQACHQPGPRHRLLHLGQKLVPPRLLLFAGVLRLGKTPLTLHRSAPGPTPGRFYPIPDPKRDYFSASLKVALALEDMQAHDVYGQMNTMRKTDHQLLSPFYTAIFTKPVKYDSEKTGWGWKTESTSTTQDLTFPSNCKMKRPAGA